MTRRSILILAAILTLALPAAAEQTATVPGWSPRQDQKQTWRIELESARGRSGTPGRWGEVRAAYVQHMTVLGSTLNGYSVSWDFDVPEENPEGNSYQRAIMAIYGVERLAIGVDRGGMPLIAYGAQGRDERLAEYLRLLSRDQDADAQAIEGFRISAAEDALFEVQQLAKPAIIIGRLQRSSPWTVGQGDKYRLQQTDHLFNSPVTGEAEFTVEAIDTLARHIKVSWAWEIPASKLPQEWQKMISQQLSETAGQAFAVPLPLRGDAGTTSFIYRGRAFLSLDDGSLLSAEEERTLRIGFETQYLTSRFTRQP